VRLHIFTIVLDGMPFLPTLFSNFNRLPSHIDWHWSVVEGAAMNVLDTRWCQPQKPRLSTDGTSQFLYGLSHHPRVTIHQQPMWKGKVAMCNACLDDFTESGILLECDADELWLPHQLVELLALFEHRPHINCARFFCRYFVGPNIVITSEDSYGNRPTEWLRAWRFEPGMQFATHEPPVIAGVKESCALRNVTRGVGLVFDHYAYAFEKTLVYKEQFYGYRDAVKHWRRLQQNDKWPIDDLHAFLPWVDKGVTADLVWR
jgi:hypothetical protein